MRHFQHCQDDNRMTEMVFKIFSTLNVQILYMESTLLDLSSYFFSLRNFLKEDIYGWIAIIMCARTHNANDLIDFKPFSVDTFYLLVTYRVN